MIIALLFRKQILFEYQSFIPSVLIGNHNCAGIAPLFVLGCKAYNFYSYVYNLDLFALNLVAMSLLTECPAMLWGNYFVHR